MSWLQGKTQLVKGKLQGLPEELVALTINLNYFSDVASFQKVGLLAGVARPGLGWRWGGAAAQNLMPAGVQSAHVCM